MTIAQPIRSRSRPRTRRWTVEEYYRLGELGFLTGERVELLDGKICQMPPLNHPHVSAVDATAEALKLAFGPSCWVRTQAPLHIAGSAPQPDVAVVSGSRREHQDHPTAALLVVEISDTTLHIDRWKAGLYAAGGVQDYWILDLVHRTLEVRRDPIADPGIKRFRHRYRSVLTVAADQSIAPLARPNVPVAVTELLP